MAKKAPAKDKAKTKPKAKAAKKPAAKKPAPTKEQLLVGTKVKAALRAHDLKVGEGTIETINDLVHWYITQGALRAKANGRKTVRGHDFILMEAYNR